MKLEKVKRVNQVSENDYIVLSDNEMVRVYKVISIDKNIFTLNMFELPNIVSIDLKVILNIGTLVYKIPQKA